VFGVVRIFINLKRFEVPRSQGGICPSDDPYRWIRSIIRAATVIKIPAAIDLHLIYLLPEGLIFPALKALKGKKSESSIHVSVGSQGVHWQDITRGGNFGAFTSMLPARAARNLGCSWAMVGHSEERQAKLELLAMYNPDIVLKDEAAKRARAAVNRAIGLEVECALQAGLNVLLCVGESEQEKGQGYFEEQKPRIQAVLREQLSVNLSCVRTIPGEGRIVIGYEPLWAIGPGKIPPAPEYIGFVSSCIKEAVQELFGFNPPVVYGGGLKEENAGMIAGIKTIDGGLVALTRFSGEIGHEPEGFRCIIDRYLESIL